MANFEKGETIVCSIEVYTAGTTTKVSPATSMTVTITDVAGSAVVSAQAMTPDDTGEYHYDYTPASDVRSGRYAVLYVATDGTRITKHRDNFDIVP
jgi:hypothetical protein